MDNKERWDGVRALLLSCDVGDTFFADAHPGLNCSPNWSERTIIEHHGNAIVSVWSSNGEDRQKWDVANMLSHRVLDHNPIEKHYAEQDQTRRSSAPEPKKIEAEKLFDEPLLDRSIWVNGVEWKIFGARQTTGNETASYRARCVPCDFHERSFTKEDFSELDITATRPKTEREKELELELNKSDRLSDGELASIKRLQSRVNELEADRKELIECRGCLRNSRLREVSLQERVNVMEARCENAIDSIAAVGVEVDRVLKQTRK